MMLLRAWTSQSIPESGAHRVGVRVVGALQQDQRDGGVLTAQIGRQVGQIRGQRLLLPFAEFDTGLVGLHDRLATSPGRVG